MNTIDYVGVSDGIKSFLDVAEQILDYLQKK